MSVVLMVHAVEAGCFLTCGLCNLCLKIDQEHPCDNLLLSLKIEHCQESYERCKSIRDNRRKNERWFYTDRDGYLYCQGPANIAFARGVDSKKMIKMNNFAQGVTKIVVRAANKNHALPGEHKIK